MRFGNLHYFWILWLIPIIIIFFIWALKRKKMLLENFVDPVSLARLLVGFSYSKQRIKILLLIFTLLCAILALVRPQWGFKWEEVKRRGVDIIIALDVSRSMLAQDVSPNRLERAKREIIDLLSIMEGDRAGLVAFAGTSFLQSPLTLDYGAVRIFLDDIDTEFIPVPGTAIGEAIHKSIDAFDKSDKKSRVLILITDGEDHLGDPLEAARKASKEGVKIYTIGIGKQEGAPIPDGESGGFKKDRAGNLILTHLDESTLQKIALNTGGSYVRSVTGDLDLEKIYADITKNVEDKELKSGRRKRFEERFQWPLALAALFLLIEVLLSTRKSTTFVMFFLLFLSPDLMASKQREGEKLYKNGKYDEALTKFLGQQIEDPDNIELKYNLASAYYKMGQFDKASTLFTSVAHSTEKTLAAKAYYDLGNSAYRQGKLAEAVDFYKKAIELNPTDKDAKYNLEFVRQEIKKRIEENKKRQQKQQKQKQKQKQQNKDQKQKEGDKKEQQQPQQQKKQGQKKKEEDSKKDKKKDKKKEQGSTGAKVNPKDKKKKLSDKDKKEAMRWLKTLKEDRKKYLKRKMRQMPTYQVEKDW